MIVAHPILPKNVSVEGGSVDELRRQSRALYPDDLPLGKKFCLPFEDSILSQNYLLNLTALKNGLNGNQACRQAYNQSRVLQYETLPDWAQNYVYGQLAEKYNNHNWQNAFPPQVDIYNQRKLLPEFAKYALHRMKFGILIVADSFDELIDYCRGREYLSTFPHTKREGSKEILFNFRIPPDFSPTAHRNPLSRFSVDLLAIARDSMLAARILEDVCRYTGLKLEDHEKQSIVHRSEKGWGICQDRQVHNIVVADAFLREEQDGLPPGKRFELIRQVLRAKDPVQKIKDLLGKKELTAPPTRDSSEHTNDGIEDHKRMATMAVFRSGASGCSNALSEKTQRRLYKLFILSALPLEAFSVLLGDYKGEQSGLPGFVRAKLTKPSTHIAKEALKPAVPPTERPKSAPSVNSLNPDLWVPSSGAQLPTWLATLRTNNPRAYKELVQDLSLLPRKTFTDLLKFRLHGAHNLFEVKRHCQNGFRIYFTIRDGHIIALRGGTKQSQISDIQMAQPLAASRLEIRKYILIAERPKAIAEQASAKSA